MAPNRVQLRRTRGWRLPEGAVKVDRTTRWGNPFRDGPAEVAVARYAEALRAGELAFTVDDVRAALAGHDLACWCPDDRPCHADVLLVVANGGPVPGGAHHRPMMGSGSADPGEAGGGHVDGRPVKRLLLPAAAVVVLVAMLAVVACSGDDGGDEAARPTLTSGQARSTTSTTSTMPAGTATTPLPAPTTAAPSTTPAAASVAAALAGVHVLLQVPQAAGGTRAQALAELEAQRPAIERALAAPGVVALSVRVPWSVIADDLVVLDRARAIATAAGRQLTVRFMAGRHTPAAVLDAGPTITASGVRAPAPFTPTGGPNEAFLSAYRALVERLATWARANDVHLVHLSHYGLDWAELYDGPEVQALAGSASASADALVAATAALADIGIDAAGPGLSFELAMSGHGPLMRPADAGPPGVSERVAQHIVERIGVRDDRFFVQGNGWDERGIWGAPNPAVSARFDAVLDAGALLGVQMIQPGNRFDWAATFAVAEAARATYAEVYLPSFTGGSAAQLLEQAARFRPHLP